MSSKDIVLGMETRGQLDHAVLLTERIKANRSRLVSRRNGVPCTRYTHSCAGAHSRHILPQ